MKKTLVTRGSTLLLRLIIVLMGLGAFGIAMLVWYPTLTGEAWEVLHIVIGMTLAALPFYFCLLQGWRLLDYIDSGKAFSELSVTALHKTKYAALLMSGIYVMTTPFLYPLAQDEDAPGIMVIGMLAAFAPFVIAVFAEVMQKVLEQAIALKKENDLTV